MKSLPKVLSGSQMKSDSLHLWSEGLSGSQIKVSTLYLKCCQGVR